MTAQMATRLTLRTFKHKKRKVSIDFKAHQDYAVTLDKLYHEEITSSETNLI